MMQLYDKEEIMTLAKAANRSIFLDVPVYAEEAEIKFLHDILNCCSNLGIVANNYYALELTVPAKTIIGSELNVVNSYSIEFYRKLGYKNIILNKENFYSSDLMDSA